jgi:hypothetical protein
MHTHLNGIFSSLPITSLPMLLSVSQQIWATALTLLTWQANPQTKKTRFQTWQWQRLPEQLCSHYNARYVHNVGHTTDAT